jgi:hypothetical protein
MLKIPKGVATEAAAKGGMAIGWPTHQALTTSRPREGDLEARAKGRNHWQHDQIVMEK